MKDLYREAVTEGNKHYLDFHGNGATSLLGTEPVLGTEGPGYWIARHAAREATDALLTKAKEIGVTDEQWEALRVVAAEVAYD